jgi:hypothetical protein
MRGNDAIYFRSDAFFSVRNGHGSLLMRSATMCGCKVFRILVHSGHDYCFQVRAKLRDAMEWKATGRYWPVTLDRNYHAATAGSDVGDVPFTTSGYSVRSLRVASTIDKPFPSPLHCSCTRRPISRTLKSPANDPLYPILSIVHDSRDVKCSGSHLILVYCFPLA